MSDWALQPTARTATCLRPSSHNKLLSHWGLIDAWLTHHMPLVLWHLTICMQSIGLLIGATINNLKTCMTTATISMLTIMLVGKHCRASATCWQGVCHFLANWTHCTRRLA